MRTTTQTNDFVIVALDYDNQAEALSLVSKLESIQFYKVGMELFYSAGFSIIEELKNRQKKIFLDLKLNDIPSTIFKAVKSLSRFEVDLLTVFTDGDGVRAASEAAGSGLKILNVTVLTSVESADQGQMQSRVIDRALLTRKSGGHGVVCSGYETAMVKEAVSGEFIIVNPGIRPAGSEAGDQKRVVTPSQALQSGASHIVIGRPITQAADPALAARQILESLTV